MPKRPNLGLGLAISGPAYVWETPRTLLGGLSSDRTVLGTTAAETAKTPKSACCTSYEELKSPLLRKDLNCHHPNGFCNNAQATQAYAPRWEA